MYETLLSFLVGAYAGAAGAPRKEHPKD